jgi:hypothetical protein
MGLGAIDHITGKRSDPLEVNFRMRDGILIPYVKAVYPENGKDSPVKHIVLGPKNQNSELAIEAFLNTLGLTEVKVSRSTAPYR